MSTVHEPSIRLKRGREAQMSKMPDFSHLPVTISGWILSSRPTIEIDHYLVKVTEKGRFGATPCEWNAPVSDFRGVLRRSEMLLMGGGDGAEWVTWHNLILAHPDEKKSLELYTSQVEADTHILWGAAARALQLPALYETGDGIVSRAPEDLGKPLRQLAMEGKVSVDFDVQAPPPEGIVREAKQGYQRVTFGHEFFKRCIAITPEGICHSYRKTPFGTFFLKVIQLAKLKSLDRYDSIPSQFSFRFLAGGWISGQGAIVEMESDRARISVGGLNDEQSHWLKNFILAEAIDVSR